MGTQQWLDQKWLDQPQHICITVVDLDEVKLYNDILHYQRFKWFGMFVHERVNHLSMGMKLKKAVWSMPWSRIVSSASRHQLFGLQKHHDM